MSQPKQIKIVTADDHEFFRLAFKKILAEQYPELSFIDSASNGKELLEKVSLHKPDVVITDIKMPLMDGIEATKNLKKKFPAIPVIAFSMFEDTDSIFNMLSTGVKSYIAKTSPKEEIVNGIRSVLNGQSFYCSTVSDKIFSRNPNSNSIRAIVPKVTFNQQETEVLKLICQQHSTKEIETTLDLAVRTVENYRYNIQQKIGAKNVVGVALYALMNNLVILTELGVCG